MSGLTVKSEVMADHERRYGQHLHPRSELLTKDSSSQASTFPRPESLGPWVLDVLRCEGRRMQVSPRLFLQIIIFLCILPRRPRYFQAGEEARANHVSDSRDPDLLRPFEEARQRAKQNGSLTAELEALMVVLRANRAKYERLGAIGDDVDIKVWRQGMLCDISHDLHSELATVDWKHSSRDEMMQVAASYAYFHGLQSQLFMEKNTK